MHNIGKLTQSPNKWQEDQQIEKKKLKGNVEYTVAYRKYLPSLTGEQYFSKRLWAFI